MFPPGTRGRARGLPYTMDAFMLGMGMLGESGWDTGGSAESPWTGGDGHSVVACQVDIMLYLCEPPFLTLQNNCEHGAEGWMDGGAWMDDDWWVGNG